MLLHPRDGIRLASRECLASALSKATRSRAQANLQVDIPLLYYPVTQTALDKAYTFYGIWFESAGAVKVSQLIHPSQLNRMGERAKPADQQAMFHVALALPMCALIFKLHGWSESAMFFDGSSLGRCS